MVWEGVSEVGTHQGNQRVAAVKLNSEREGKDTKDMQFSYRVLYLDLDLDLQHDGEASSSSSFELELATPGHFCFCFSRGFILALALVA